MDFMKVAGVDDLKDGEGKVCQANGKQIALFKHGGNFFALDNTCLHRGGPLGEGMLDGDSVVCPWHGWQYDLKTGVSNMNPALKVAVFETKIQGKDVLVKV